MEDTTAHFLGFCFLMNKTSIFLFPFFVGEGGGSSLFLLSSIFHSPVLLFCVAFSFCVFIFSLYFSLKFLLFPFAGVCGPLYLALHVSNPIYQISISHVQSFVTVLCTVPSFPIWWVFFALFFFAISAHSYFMCSLYALFSTHLPAQSVPYMMRQHPLVGSGITCAPENWQEPQYALSLCYTSWGVYPVKLSNNPPPPSLEIIDLLSLFLLLSVGYWHHTYSEGPCCVVVPKPEECYGFFQVAEWWIFGASFPPHNLNFDG